MIKCWKSHPGIRIFPTSHRQKWKSWVIPTFCHKPFTPNLTPRWSKNAETTGKLKAVKNYKYKITSINGFLFVWSKQGLAVFIINLVYPGFFDLGCLSDMVHLIVMTRDWVSALSRDILTRVKLTFDWRLEMIDLGSEWWLPLNSNVPFSILECALLIGQFYFSNFGMERPYGMPRLLLIRSIWIK